MAKNKSIYIDRAKIPAILKQIGKSHWKSFKVGQPVSKGSQRHYEVVANNRKASICFNFNDKGTTSIFSSGKNTDITEILISDIKKKFISSSSIKGKTKVIRNVSNQDAQRLIQHLKDTTSKTSITSYNKSNNRNINYTFKGKCGDRLHVSIFNNGTITIQGKPAYLYNDALSYIAKRNIAPSKKPNKPAFKLHKSSDTNRHIHKALKELLPNSYDLLDETILELLSPSVYLQDMNLPMEDYSCYAFPALRALEGYIKLAFLNKNIKVKDLFTGMFVDGTINATLSNKINDDMFVVAIERAYDYYRHVRHSLFHANQELDKTPMVKTKDEADDIIRNVINIIDGTSEVLLT